MEYAPGSLVKARGREWVVLPESEDDMLILRPLGGSDDEITGIYTPIEPVEEASFSLPDPSQIGDAHSCRLLRDAVRLGLRSSAGPFRSFAKIAVEPRPYQLVPLLMALRQDPVRLLIADDVGVGKTIEACLIARELLDRGEVKRMTVLCPPHLAEQWQGELRDKFHIDAELVLHSTARRLEQAVVGGKSLFEHYDYTVVSTDFIKTDRRREEFLRACPELVIVDEAHTCASDPTTRSTRHQRHHLIKGISDDDTRNLILVTATPHTGNEEAFRSLLGLVDPEFLQFPADLTGRENEARRRRVAGHLVQRRRGDIRSYMEAVTKFPERQELEVAYKLSPDYERFFRRVVSYARETVQDEDGGGHRQRVRYWSMLALLRTLASSPAAAAATLRTRAKPAETDTVQEADEIGMLAVLDRDDAQGDEVPDTVSGSDYAPDEEEGDDDSEERRALNPERRRLRDMARDADKLMGTKDKKLVQAVDHVADLLKKGYAPILFCRYIATAEYVAEELRKRLPKLVKNVEVDAVTGSLPPREREQRVGNLGQHDKRVLVCTDCLSEGINLQDSFDAVMHYDLSWNPTRHEQREGRVDRFGQAKDTVRVLTYYGEDNGIDGIVLDVLLRKHKAIQKSLEVNVAVPQNTEQVLNAIFEGFILRREAGTSDQLLIPVLEEHLNHHKTEFHAQWDTVAERDRQSRSLFAQRTIRVEEVAEQLDAAQAAVGSGVDVVRFTKEALRLHGASVAGGDNGADPMSVDMSEAPIGLRDVLGLDDAKFSARFRMPVEGKELYLHRTHPVVEGLANYVTNAALDSELSKTALAKRAGAMRTSAVARRTTLLLTRFRFHIISQRGRGQERPLLAEDCLLLGFEGAPGSAEWIDPADAEALLDASPSGSITPEQARDFVATVVDEHSTIQRRLDEVAVTRAAELLRDHEQVRESARDRTNYRVEPQLPPDILGIYVLLPTPGGRS